MPPHGFMKDEQLAYILSYVRNAWGNQGKIISTEDIAEYRKDEAKRVSLWTESEF
jgi:mono/diheme cytochrome c family protein